MDKALTPAPLPDDVATLASELNAISRAMTFVDFHIKQPDLELTNMTCRSITREAAAALASCASRLAVVEAERDAAMRECSRWAREAGEAIGRLEMSEAAGIVDGWRDRATTAEARAEAAERALEEIATLCAGGKPQGSLPYTIARAILDRREASHD